MGRTATFRNGFVTVPPRPSVLVPRRRVPRFKSGMKGEDARRDSSSTAFLKVRQLHPNRARVLSSDSHLRLLVPKYVRDDLRYGIFGKLT
jgi:hypothetical protein